MRSLYKLISTCWVLIHKSVRISEMEHFGKIVIAFNYFCKTLHIKSLRGFLNMFWVLNMSGLWTPRLMQPFILPRLIKWVPGISGNLVVKSKLPPHSSSVVLKQLNPMHFKGQWSLKFNFYSRIVNMSGFWISRVTQGLPIFVNMTGFLTYIKMQLWKGCKYSKILNMPCFCICKCYTTFWICLIMAE